MALRLLARRDYAAAELRERLLRRGVTPETAEQVLTDLSEYGYVNDDRFAQTWVSSRSRGKGLGRRRLWQELRQKGIAPEQAEAALAAYDPADELGIAVELAERRLRQLAPADRPEDRAKARQKIAQYLQRRGFDWDIIQTALNRAFD